MFGIFKLGRRKKFTEADFDILTDVTIRGVTMTKAEIVWIFLDWTQEPSRMTSEKLGRMIVDRCAGFKERFADQILASRDSYGMVFAQALVDHLKAAKLLKPAGRKSAAQFEISKRGEQIRQFYVLKLNLRRSLYDRMDRFTAA